MKFDALKQQALDWYLEGVPEDKRRPIEHYDVANIKQLFLLNKILEKLS